MRFIHTGDWHLGRLFHNIHLTDDQRFTLEGLLRLAEEVRADAVVIAGDVYDRAVPPTQAVELLDDILGDLALRLRIPVVDDRRQSRQPGTAPVSERSRRPRGRPRRGRGRR